MTPSYARLQRASSTKDGPSVLPALALPSRGGAALRALLVLTLVALSVVGVGTLPSARAIGAPVVVDDFGGTVRGTRTVQVVNTGTSPDPTFTQAGGIGTMRLNGAGNSTTGIQLDYAFPQTDLTVGGSNTQFFVEFTGIQRTPEVLGENAASISISVTDSSGRTGVYNTGIGNTGDWDVVLNFECTSSPVCFSPQVDFTRVTALSLLVLYPRNQDPSHTTVVTIDALRTTPTGGVAPTPPAAEVTAPATTGGTVYAAAGTTLEFPVRFASDGTDVDVTGLSVADVVATGTAPGSGQLSLTGSGSSYVVRVGPVTGDGTVGIRLPAGVVQDAWGQDSTTAEASVGFYVSVPPVITGTLPTAATIGTAFSADLAATGRPAPTFAVTAGALPPGLALSSGGRLAGTPTTGGTYTFTVTATNVLGTATQATTMTVTGPPVLDHAATATFTRGQAGSFGVSAGGYPVPTITAAGLPAGLTLTDRGDGTASITGTPTADGTSTVTLTATNSVATRTSTLAVTVQSAPSITSSDDATFTRGTAGSFTVRTTGVPAPALTLTAGTLPAGLTFVDNGDGTASLSGTPTASGMRLLTVRAQNAAGSATQQLWVTSLEAPAITSTGDATFVAGRAGSTTITTTGYPLASISVSGTLPDGLSFVDNWDGTATLSGTPTTAGTSTLTVIAANGVSPSARRTLTVVVQQAPAFSSATDATMTVDQAGSFVVRTTGSPAAALTLVGGDLPAGLELTDNGDGTATLAGTPEASGTTSLTLRATNAAGSQEQVLTLVVVEPLRFTTPDHVLLVVGEPASFDVLSTGYPAPLASSITCDDAPAGLSLQPLGVHGARLHGTPTTPGTAVCEFSVHHPLSGTATQTLTIDVASRPAVTGPAGATFVVGRTGSVTVTSTGSPAPALTVVGTLPDGLAFVDHGDGTGTIAGAPTGDDDATVRVVATNAAGTDDADLTITVHRAPAVTSAASTTFTLGTGGSFTVTSAGDPLAALTLAGTLPAGLTFTDDGDGTATIAGTPTAAGTFLLAVTAANAAGDDEQELRLVVQDAPVFTSAPSARFTQGTAVSWDVTTTGYPAAALTLAGALPAGLTFTDDGDGTATIAGTPTATGTSEVTVSAAGVAGTADQRLTLEVVAAPAFTSGATATFELGTASSYDVTTTGYPTATLALTGALPAGLAFTDEGDGSARLAGTPTEDGTFTVDVTATSGAGTTTQTLRVVVTRAPVITSPDAAPFTEGTVGRFVVRATGNPLPALTLTGTLPPGLTFTDEGDGTAVIAGTPAPGSAGTYRVTITAVAAPAPLLRGSGLSAAALAGAPLAVGDSQTLVITVAGDDDEAPGPGDGGGSTPGDDGSDPDDGGSTPDDGGTTPGDDGSTPGDDGTAAPSASGPSELGATGIPAAPLALVALALLATGGALVVTTRRRRA